MNCIARSARLAILALSVFGLAASTLAAETTVGRWCDRMLPNMPDMDSEITIRINGAGQAEAISRFGDGSSLRQNLIEQGGNTYLVKGSPSRDQFRIVSSSGELQILDKNGLISVARRLGNKPRAGDCVRGR